MGRLVGVTAAPFTYVSHVLGVAAAALVLVWCIQFRGGLAFESTNKNLIFNIHPVLMLIGFIILGGEAIMSYRGLPWSKEVKKLIHLILHAIAVVLGVVGIYAAFKFHNESGIANLYSLHSWLGLGTICLYVIQGLPFLQRNLKSICGMRLSKGADPPPIIATAWPHKLKKVIGYWDQWWIFGFVTFFFPGAAPGLRRDSLPWHVLFGLFVYILAVATGELGFLEKLTFLESSGLDKYGTEAFLVNFTALIVVLLGASVVVSAIAPTKIEDPRGYSAISES